MTNPESPSNPSTEPTIDRPTPGAPSDNATLTEMMNTLAEDGFVHQFFPIAGGAVECSRCSTQVDASQLEVVSTRRLEGASDPDDMMSLVAARCPNCHAPGTLLLGYGVNASVDDADVQRSLQVPVHARVNPMPSTPVTPPAHD
jgi:hypothetical protein